MLNKAVLIGRLTREPDMRFTQSKKAVCSFNLAVNRNFTTKNGEREADFIQVICWGRNAENVSKFLSKGSLCAVEGRIQTRNYNKDDGQRIYVTEVVAERVNFLENLQNKKNATKPQGFVDANKRKVDLDESNQLGIEFVSNNDPFADFGNSIDISNDDLPF
ncbi:MAG: single-stranded DNA-binding protein [Bacilli bacterium]